MPPGTARPPTAPVGVWLPSWLLLVLVWGFAFLFIKVAVEVLAPLQVAFGRVALGAAVVLVLVVATRRRLPRDWRVWRDVSAVALFLHTAPFTLFAFGETRISSVLAGIWNATTPLWAVLFGLALLPEERLTRERLAGLTLGFVGVLVVLGVWQGVGGADLLGSAACVAATACYGVGVSLTRRLLSGRPEGPLPLVGAQLTSGALQLAVLVLVFTAPPGSLPLDVVGAMLLLGVASTGLAFVLNFRIVRDAGPVVSAATTYATPLVSTVAGVVLLGEPLAWYQPVGAAVVLSGVALIQGLVRLPRRGGADG